MKLPSHTFALTAFGSVTSMDFNNVGPAMVSLTVGTLAATTAAMLHAIRKPRRKFLIRFLRAAGSRQHTPWCRSHSDDSSTVVRGASCGCESSAHSRDSCSYPPFEVAPS